MNLIFNSVPLRFAKEIAAKDIDLGNNSIKKAVFILVTSKTQTKEMPN